MIIRPSFAQQLFAYARKRTEVASVSENHRLTPSLLPMTTFAAATARSRGAFERVRAFASQIVNSKL
jgi:hypothetical protein